ncbi:MAG: hypothetical protein QHH30_10180, partial [candidate division NC10 bacterium]|nr:hypothetical protein [candidate division NC10 bacterium]
MRRGRCIQVLSIAAIVACSLCPSAWAGVPDQPTRKGYRFSESAPHLWLYWNCDPAGEKAEGIEGMVEVKGQSNSPVYDLQLKLIAFDEKGRPIGEEVALAPHKLLPNMSFRFHLPFPRKGEEAEVGLRVYYRYLSAEGGGGPRASRISYSMDFYDWTFGGLCS